MSNENAVAEAEIVEPSNAVELYRQLGWPEPGESSEEAEMRIIAEIISAETVDDVFAPWTGQGTDDVAGKAISMTALEPFWILRDDRWIPGLRVKAVDLATGEEIGFATTARALVTQAAKLSALGKLDLKLRVVEVSSTTTGRRSYHFEPA